MKKSDKLKNLEKGISFNQDNELMRIYNKMITNESDTEQLIKLIKYIDTYLMSIDSLLSKDIDINKETFKIKEFMIFFIQKHANNKEFEERLKEIWKENPPKLYNIYLGIIEEEHGHDVEKLYDQLKEYGKKNVKILYDYINEIDDSKQFIFIGDLEGTNNELCGMLEILKEDSEKYQQVLFEYSTKLVKNNGSLILRYIENDEIIINGFTFNSQHIYKLDSKILKVFLDNNEDIKKHCDTENFQFPIKGFEVAKCTFVK